MNNESLFAPVFEEKIQMVSVRFQGDGSMRTYDYKCLVPVELGDHVLVQVNNDLQIKVASVVKLNVDIPIDSDKSYKWVIYNIQEAIEAHVITQEWERNLIDQINRQKVNNYRKQMQAVLGVTPDDLELLSATAEEEAVVVVE